MLALALLTILGRGQSAYAEPGWSTPTVVFRTTSDLARPRIVADASGDVHLFFALHEDASASGGGTSNTIMYSRLHDGVWSPPADILIATVPGADSPSATVDARGVLHLIWQGGPNGELAYSQAHATQATTTRNWSRPRLISDTAVRDSDIALSGDNTLHVVYSDQLGSVWYRYSNDGGLTWSPLAAVFDAVGSPCASNHPHVAADGRGIVHVVWTTLQLPTGWPPCGALYSDSLDSGRTWASPVRIAGPGYGQMNLSLSGPSTVALAWNAMVAIGERKFTWSTDGGFSWRDPMNFAPRLRGGFTAVPSIAVDSAGIIHIATSVDGQRGDTQAVYHLSWDGVRWSEPLRLSIGAIGARAVESPWLTIGTGNQLHVVYHDDYQRIWYTTRSTSAPATVPQALPAPSSIAVNPPAVGATEPTADRNAVVPHVSPPTDTGLFSQSRNPFLLGILPVAVVLAGIVLVRVLQRTRG